MKSEIGMAPPHKHFLITLLTLPSLLMQDMLNGKSASTNVAHEWLCELYAVGTGGVRKNTQ